MTRGDVRNNGLHATPPPRSCESSSGGYILDDPELLDLMEAAEDTALMLRVRAHYSEAPPSNNDIISGIPGQPPNATNPENSEAMGLSAITPQPCQPTPLLVGGSLFLRNTSVPLSAAIAHRKTLSPLGAMGAAAGSFFCPFTRGFVSMCSPHWGHLAAVGFRVRMSLHGGRRVVLQKPQLLLARARLLQGCTMQDTPKIPSTLEYPRSASSTKTRKDSPCTGARQTHPETLFKTWGWSPHLQRTLGATLCSAPLGNMAAFRAAVEASMLTGGLCQDAQLIPAIGACGSWGVSPVSLVQSSAPRPREMEPKRYRPVTRCPWDTRCRALQLPSSLRLGCSSTSTVASWATASASDQMGPLPTLPPAWPAWAAAHTARPTLQLFSLPASVRAAFLDVPFPSPSTSSSSLTPTALMEATCGATLSQLAEQLQDAVEQGRLAATSRLYFCPLAHAVDYNATLDLRAFRVKWSRRHGCNDGRVDVSAAPRLPVTLSDSSPVLSLGMELPTSEDGDPSEEAAGRAAFTPPLRVVVFSNAHMLSKRAIRRLLDQWTRNGTSVRQLRQQRECGQAGPRVSRTLMGSRWPLPLDTAAVLPHVQSLCIPFGDVQAVFIGYTACQDLVEEVRAMDSSPDAGTHALPPLPVLLPSTRSFGSPVRVELAVSVRAHSDLFHVEEPLSAALLRASTFYRRCLDAAQRCELVEAVVQSILDVAPAGTAFAKRQSQRLSSGRLVFETSKTDLTSTQGRLLLHEACEAALSLVSPLEDCLYPLLRTERTRGNPLARDDDVVSVLVTYPLLSTLQIRHVLLSAFHVRVTLTSTTCDAASSAVAAAAAAAVDRPSTAGKGMFVPCGTDSGPVGAAMTPTSAHRVRFVDSRLRANEYEQIERHALLQKAKVRAAAAAAASVMLVPSSAPPAPLVFQAYAAHVDPPVLLGLWTTTLLFRAPAQADVMALRCFLLEPLRMSYATSHRNPTEVLSRADFADGGAGSGGRILLRVSDVDIIRFDYADWTKGPRHTHCLYGVRASLCPASEAIPHPRSKRDALGEESLRDANGCDFIARELALLTALLQQCLMEYARAATFFPLWRELRRYDDAAVCATTQQSSEVGLTAKIDDGDPTRHNLLRFPLFPSDTNRRSFLDFTGVTESSAAWTPRLIEMRLLSLAAAQRPLLSLTIRSRVVLLESVYVPASDEVDTQDDDAAKAAPGNRRMGSKGVVFRRGQVCEVAGFLPCDLLLRRGRRQRRRGPPGNPEVAKRAPRVRPLFRPSCGSRWLVGLSVSSDW
ncbi:hypothetical protein, conserved [Leishmania tarentolae]|uniref:Uncharacterized protein n=1 Tax=Leishmania tarentolae TaxID=5689 RepID=A0A640KFS8_LEITA|nr:hypothetical protein, conserved [Leishmania tarentolae]